MERHDELEPVARLIFEAGQLKRSKRVGWWLAGIDDPESVAEHSFRTAFIGYVLATLEGANPERTALLCLLHDLPEARMGDVPRIGKRYLVRHSGAEIAREQARGLPERLGKTLAEAVASYEDADSIEARLAHDADRLECMTQALEYQAKGFANVTEWIVTSFAELETAPARELGARLMVTNPSDWWRKVLESHRSTDPARHSPPLGDDGAVRRAPSA